MKGSFNLLRIIVSSIIMVSIWVLSYYAFALNSLILFITLGAYSFIVLELYHAMRKSDIGAK